MAEHYEVEDKTKKKKVYMVVSIGEEGAPLHEKAEATLEEVFLKVLGLKEKGYTVEVYQAIELKVSMS